MRNRMQLHPNNFTLFVNGWVVSLGLGYGHYCSNRDLNKSSVFPRTESLPETQTVEVCVWLEGMVDTLQLEMYQPAAGWVPVDKVLDLVQKLRTTPPEVQSFPALESWWKGE